MQFSIYFAWRLFHRANEVKSKIGHTCLRHQREFRYRYRIDKPWRLFCVCVCVPPVLSVALAAGHPEWDGYRAL